MTDRTMIERVARAIYEEDDPWHKVWPWPDLQEDQTEPEKYRQVAIAAIKAMREPTMDMVQRGAEDADPVGCCLMAPSNAADVWQIMIDAALKGEEG